MKHLELFETYNETGIIKLRETIETKKAIGDALNDYFYVLNLDDINGQYTSAQSRSVYSKTTDHKYNEGVIDITKKQNKFEIIWRNQNFFKTEYTLLKEWFKEHNMIYTIKRHDTQPPMASRINPKDDFTLGEFRKWKNGVLIEEYNMIAIMYIKVSEINDFIKSINEFTTSDDLDMYINAKKYNL